MKPHNKAALCAIALMLALIFALGFADAVESLH